MIAANEICVKIKPNVTDATLQNYVSQYGGIVDQKDYNAPLRWRVIRFPQNILIENIFNTFRNNLMFENVEYNFVGEPQDIIPNDPYFNLQWGLENSVNPSVNVGFTKAWEITTGDSNIVIAVFDSGIPMDENYNFSHPDLDEQQKFLRGVDLTGSRDSIKDKFGHGTSVLGIMGAETNNNIGVSGVCWKCKFIILKGIDTNYNSFVSYFRRAVEYLVWWKSYSNYNRTLILNASISYDGPSDSVSQLIDAVRLAKEDGILIVVSMGNWWRRDRQINYLAALSSDFSNIISVGATGIEGNITFYSLPGRHINVCAPGGHSVNFDGIFTTDLSGYQYRTGTSMAAPFVSGLSGLILSLGRDYEPSLVRNIIERTAVDRGSSGFDTIYGYGIINADKATYLNNFKPQNISISLFNNYPKITWNYVHNATSYNVYKGIDLGFTTDYNKIATISGSYNYFINYSQRINPDAPLGMKISYRVTALVNNEESLFSDKVSVRVNLPSLEKGSFNNAYYLFQNFPNPFNNITTIGFIIPKPSLVKFEILDPLGRVINKIEKEFYSSGYYELSLDFSDKVSGIYFLRMKMDEFSSLKKLLLLK